MTQGKTYSDQDQSHISLALKKKGSPQAPSFKKSGNDGSLIPMNGDHKLTRAGLAEAFGTINTELIDILLDQVYHSASGISDHRTKNLNASLAILHGIQPQDELEGVLAAQMVGVHNLAMEFMRRAMALEQTFEGVTANTERAIKMLRTFTTQIEALNRYRGKGQQKVTVEHVTIKNGGQAIIGQITPQESKLGPGGLNENPKKE